MTFRFELPNGYSTADLIALNKLSQRRDKVRRLGVPIFRLFLAVLSVSFFFSAYTCWRDSSLSKGIFSLVMGVLLLLLAGAYFPITARLTRLLLGKSIGGITLILDDENFTSQSQNGSEHCPYDAFSGAFLFQDRWFLMLDAQHAMVLPKSALTQGDPAAFAGFWQEKTGKAIQELT